MGTTANLVQAQLAQKGLRPKSEWLESFMSGQRPSTPLPSIIQTAQFRLLNSNITNTLQPSPCFPVNVGDSRVEEKRMSTSFVVQVLDIEDISRSRWDQVEEIEAVERGEGTRGREIVRVTASADGDEPVTGRIYSGSTHKLLLQDATGQKASGLELERVASFSLGIDIGCKLLLENVTIARGTVLLSPRCTKMLGGKVEELHSEWKASKKARLQAAIARQEEA